MRRRPLAPRPLTEPAASRLPREAPWAQAALQAHAEALARGDAGYLDGQTGLFVLTAGFLARRGTCCERDCRHCPYTD